MAERTLIALVFDDEQEAQRLWQRNQELQVSGLLPPEDAAMVVLRRDGQVIVQQEVGPTGGDAFNAHTWEHVINTMLLPEGAAALMIGSSSR